MLIKTLASSANKSCYCFWFLSFQRLQSLQTSDLFSILLFFSALFDRAPIHLADMYLAQESAHTTPPPFFAFIFVLFFLLWLFFVALFFSHRNCEPRFFFFFNARNNLNRKNSSFSPFAPNRSISSKTKLPIE